ncbi:hypothetical protein [Aquimarina algiphila]|uniref:hypothetical protein n=1 Tax=Aquimarina algiphila TaxID=2047982 RepID=UPI001431256B|nr:hypothetical protein [Aquimarina algiphila]
MLNHFLNPVNIRVLKKSEQSKINGGTEDPCSPGHHVSCGFCIPKEEPSDVCLDP